MTERWNGWKPREGTTDQRIIDHVYVENGYEMPDDLTGKMVIDIGANIGTFSRLCAERGAKVLALEPYKPSYELLLEHVKGLTVTAVPTGLGPHNGYTQLFVHEANMGGHSITQEVGPNSVSIHVWKLSTILDLWKCDILKLDCEGAEIYAFPYLLEGGHHRVPEIVMEIHEQDFAKKMATIESLSPFYSAHNIFQADWRLTRKMTQAQWRDMAVKRVTEHFVAANMQMINAKGPIVIHERLGDKLVELAEIYAKEIVLKGEM